jgi:hypothetical protein
MILAVVQTIAGAKIAMSVFMKTDPVRIDTGTTITTATRMIVLRITVTVPDCLLLVAPVLHPPGGRMIEAGHDYDRYDRRGGYYDRAPKYDYDQCRNNYDMPPRRDDRRRDEKDGHAFDERPTRNRDGSWAC